jgi:DNA-binding NtrC family response regulator
MTARILVIDDQFSRNATERLLFLKNVGDEALAVEFIFCSGQCDTSERIVNDYAVVREAISAGPWALVLLDVRFDSGALDGDGRPAGEPGDDGFGLEVARRLLYDAPDLPIVMLTSKAQAEIGTPDLPYLSKHRLNAYELRRTLLRHGILAPAEARAILGLGEGIAAADPATLAVFRQAFVHAGSDASVLILGESGVGKDVLARYIHRISERSRGPYVAVNVAAMPKDLVEAELFGIGRHVATGVDARSGRFEAANGGTLFLDEIGDMPADTQAKVLRALQERRITRVGESRDIPIDIRLICATSRNLPALVEAGGFRGDLLYRINTVPITIPPLRERRGDIVPLANGFLAKAAGQQGISGLAFGPEAAALLEESPFPGNVRELENAVERLVSAAGHHQLLGRADVQEVMSVRPGTPVVPGATLAAAGRPSLDEVLDLLSNVTVDKDNPALKGAKPRLDAAFSQLTQRLAGAALERCRNPNDGSLNRQSAMRLLTGDATLKGKGPARLVNGILGRPLDYPVCEDDLEQLFEIWRKGE